MRGSPPWPAGSWRSYRLWSLHSCRSYARMLGSCGHRLCQEPARGPAATDDFCALCSRLCGRHGHAPPLRLIAAADGGRARSKVGGLTPGTRALLVTNWAVMLDAASALTTETFRRQAADPKLARAEALRQAMPGLIDG